MGSRRREGRWKQGREGRGGSTATHIHGSETPGTRRVNVTGRAREKRGKTQEKKKTRMREISVLASSPSVSPLWVTKHDLSVEVSQMWQYFGWHWSPVTVGINLNGVCTQGVSKQCLSHGSPQDVRTLYFDLISCAASWGVQRSQGVRPLVFSFSFFKSFGRARKRQIYVRKKIQLSFIYWAKKSGPRHQD